MRQLFASLVLWFTWGPLRIVLQALPLRLAVRLGDAAGRLVYRLTSWRQQVMAREILLLYGPSMAGRAGEQTMRDTMGLFFQRQVENLVFGTFSSRRTARHCTLVGQEHLDRALARGRGAIVLLAHFGSFLMPLPALGHRGIKVVQMAGRPLAEQKGPIYAWIQRKREQESDRLPVRFLLTDRYLGPAVRALRDNAALVIAFDGRTGHRWVEVPLLRRTARISTGPFRLAQHSGAPILPTFVVRQPDGRHHIVFEPAIEIGPEQDLESPLRSFVAIFERYLTAHPDHFAMTLCTNRLETLAGLSHSLFVEEADAENCRLA